MSDSKGLIVVAGVSVRALAQAARQGGWRVWACDLFGDLDTQRASERWSSLAAPAAARNGPAVCSAGSSAISPVAGAVDAASLRRLLAEAAAQPDVIGWVAGSGFESRPRLLDAAPAGLPLLGMSASAVAALRAPKHFFATLGRLGVPHPSVRFSPPADPAGWLSKRGGGSGGLQTHLATDVAARGSDVYYQQRMAGSPMSALFLADGQRAALIGLNRLKSTPLGDCPFVFQGAVGPIVDPVLQDRIESLLAPLVRAFGLRGLASLDFIAVDRRPWVLEINPRPSASMVLHAQAWPGGLMQAHLQAFQGRLPLGPATPKRPPALRGAETVFAGQPLVVDARLSEALDRLPGCHDVPQAGARIGQGEPLCSIMAEVAAPAATGVSAEESAEAALEARLADLRQAVRHLTQSSTSTETT